MLGEAVGHLRQAAALHRVLDPLLALRFRDAFEPRVEFEVFADGEFKIDRRMFREIADHTAHLQVVVDHVEPAERHRALRRRHEARNDAHRGGFARAVGAEKSENFTFGHGERHAGHGLEFAVAFEQPLDLDHRAAGRRCHCSTPQNQKEKPTGHGNLRPVWTTVKEGMFPCS
ncbi:MAG: hypothetical protein M5R36_30070 [Deltaproteobacteria bacterium]|nr:hypothetical protein [Deltaproteobacteria bacterium]